MFTQSRRARALSVFLFVMFLFAAGPSIAAAVAVGITSSLNPSTYGQAVTFTATIGVAASRTPKVGGGLLVGFYDGSSLLGTSEGAYNDGTGTASFTTSSLSIGSHRICAGVPDIGPSQICLTQQVNSPAEVPESDTLLLFGAGIGGLSIWLRSLWAKRQR